MGQTLWTQSSTHNTAPGLVFLFPICKSWSRWEWINQHLTWAPAWGSTDTFCPCLYDCLNGNFLKRNFTMWTHQTLPSKLSRLLACFPLSMLKNRGWVMWTTLKHHMSAVLTSKFWAIWAMLNWGNLITWDYYGEQQMLSFPFQTVFHIYKPPGILGSLKGLTSVLLSSKSSLHITCHAKQPERECKHKPCCYLCFSTRNS